MLQSILIANRGEIAVRIIRACRELGIRSIAVYSDADAGALHTRLADEAYCLGAAPARDSYLNIERIIEICEQTKAQAVHPGYGLLSESPEFAARVENAGLVFIGPSPSVIGIMGDKVSARTAAKNSDVPLLPGSDGAIDDPEQALQIANEVGYPLVVKACFGGGGRGMRVVYEQKELEQALLQAGREAAAAFGRAEVYLERYVSHARHVEVQVLGDGNGRVVHLGDRDCSVQRRHQKLIEEAPAPDLTPALREALAAAAVRLAKSVKYRSAGTVEFLVDPAKEAFYFLEMNTRLQVEHGVTEMITGIDLVHQQMHIAAGGSMPLTQDQVQPRGHAIQARIAAEDPWESFRPSPGTITAMALPLGPWLRLDMGVETGDSISGYYDSMFGKIQAWGVDRTQARERLAISLSTFQVSGVPTTAPYLADVLRQPDFVAVKHDTGSVERCWPPQPEKRPAVHENTSDPEEIVAVESVSERRITVSTIKGDIEIAVFGRGGAQRADRRNGTASNGGARAQARIGEPLAPMDGAVVAVPVTQGQTVEKGTVLVVMEAMKMEVPVIAERAGVVEEVLVNAGDVVSRGTLMVRLSNDEPA